MMALVSDFANWESVQQFKWRQSEKEGGCNACKVKTGSVNMLAFVKTC